MTLLGIIGTIILALFVRLLGVEIGVRYLPLCRWLVRIAGARLPPEERVAVESEWLAVIEDLRSPTAQLLHSLSFVVSAFRIRRAIVPETRLDTFKRNMHDDQPRCPRHEGRVTFISATSARCSSTAIGTSTR